MYLSSIWVLLSRLLRVKTAVKLDGRNCWREALIGKAHVVFNCWAAHDVGFTEVQLIMPVTKMFGHCTPNERVRQVVAIEAVSRLVLEDGGNLLIKAR